MALRIIVIDDHPLLRKGLQQLSDLSPEIEIIGESGNGEGGVVLAQTLQPDLVLLDLNMPGIKGLETLNTLKQLDPAPKVVILTVSDAQEDIVAALNAGADGYLVKDTDPEVIVQRLCSMQNGRPVLSPKIAKRFGESPRARVQRIVVIDDHPLLRKGLQQLAALSLDLNIVGETDSGADGLTMVQELQPDLVLLDLNMPGMSGLETLHALKQTESPPKVVILTISDAQEDIMAALRGGADGYILKGMDPEDILNQLLELSEGQFTMPPMIARRVAMALRTESRNAQEVECSGLTERESEILIHISEGESNKVIARKLRIAEATVKVHVKHLLKKLGLKSRVEAAVWAVNHKGTLQQTRE